MYKTIIRTTLLFILAFAPLALPYLKGHIPEYSPDSTFYKIAFSLPYLLFAFVALLGLRLNQTRIFFTMILYLAAYYLAGMKGTSWPMDIDQLLFFHVFTLFVPLGLVLIFSLEEGALFGTDGLLRGSVLLSIFILSALLPMMVPEMLSGLLSSRYLAPFESWQLSDLIAVFVVGCGIYLVFQKDKSIFVFKLVLAVSLITFIFSMNRTVSSESVDISLRIYNASAFSVISVLCLYAVYKLYWQSVYIDELTAVPNRRAFNERLKKLGRRYSIAMIDIDHFKKFNDTYGHSEGDNVLRYVATHLMEGSGGRAFRYGGEEFSLVFNGTEVNEILRKVDQVRESLASRQFYIRTSETIRKQKSAKDRGHGFNGMKKVKVTVSIGLAQRGPKHKTAEDVINAADRAMYTAKKKGRNACVRARG